MCIRDSGSAYQSLSEFKKAIEFLQLALKIAKDTENKDQEGTRYNNLGSAYKSLSEFKKAIESYQLALKIAKDTGNKDQEGAIYNNLGVPISLSVSSKKQSSFISWL